MRTMTLAAAGVAGAFGVVATFMTAAAQAGALPPGTATDDGPPPAHQPGAQDPGRALYLGRGSCSTCHGPAGKGTPLAPDLTDGAWLHFGARPTVEEIAGLVRRGVPRPVKHPAPMPPGGGAKLSDEELALLASYVRGLSDPDAAAPSGRPEAGPTPVRAGSADSLAARAGHGHAHCGHCPAHMSKGKRRMGSGIPSPG